MVGYKKQKRSQGFSLIEVMLVLAIAGIILATVLISIGQLQRNNRNEARKDDVIRLLSRVNDDRKFRNGAFAPSCDNTQPDCVVRTTELVHYDNKSDSSVHIVYINSSSAFQDGTDPQHDPTGQAGLNSITIRTQAKCDGSLMTGIGALRSNIAIQYALEQGVSDNSLHCKYL